MINLLQNERLSIRVLSGLAVGILLLYLSWALSYWFLPEGLLRGKTGAGIVSEILPENSNLFIQAILWNFAVAFLLIPLLSLMSVGRLSLGYVLALGNYVLFGIFLGTNSFSIPRSGPVPPGFGVFQSPGLYEIAAYVLVAAVLANRCLFRQENWLGGKVDRVTPGEKRISVYQWIVLLISALMILIAALVEGR